MAQHDYDIANQSFPSARGDINNVLASVLSCNSGASAPSVKAAGTVYYNTSNGVIYRRNSADSAWIVAGQVNLSGDGVVTNAGSPVGTVAAWYVGQRCIDTANNRLYIAVVADGTTGGTKWQLPYVPQVNANAPVYASAATITLPSGTRYTSSDGVLDMILASDVTLNLANSGAGGREAGTGAEAGNTWYYVHVIGDSTGVNPANAVLSTSASVITLPSGYDKSVVIPKFAIRNDAASDIVPFTMHNWPQAPYCAYNVTIARPNGPAGPTSILEVAAGSASTSYTDVTNAPRFIPPFCRLANFWLSGTAGASAAVVTIRPNGETHDGFGLVYTLDETRYPGALITMAVDSGQLIEYKSSVSSPKVQIAVAGWWG